MADGDSQHAAPGASPVMGPATNNIILTTEMHAAPVARATTSGLDQEVRAPQMLTSAAGMWTQLTSTTWHVSCHVPLDSFLHFNGPAVITRYNMNFCGPLSCSSAPPTAAAMGAAAAAMARRASSQLRDAGTPAAVCSDGGEACA